MNYEKFDIERALAGEPVILRNGLKAYIRHKEEEFKVSYSLSGIVPCEFLVSGSWETWTVDGSLFADGADSDYDIIGMYPKEPLTMPDSFWNTLNPDITYIAMEEDGVWFAYTGSPNYIEDEKLHSRSVFGEYFELSSLNQSIFPDCEPKDSLIVRPTARR